MGRTEGAVGANDRAMASPDIRLLGPVGAVDGDGSKVDLGGPKPRAVFALLALSPGEVVSADKLIDGVWGPDAPDAARRSLQTHVSNLRKSLGADAIDQRGSGYALDVDPEQIDAVRFRRLVREVRDADGPNERLALLDEALGLVRGVPLDGLGDAPFVETTRAGLEADVLEVTERRVDTLLELGRHDEVTRQLEELVSTHPLREQLRAQLMVAQYRAGRQAAALEVYEQARRILGDELGIDPSPRLQELHQRILRQDPSLEAQPAARPRSAARPEPASDGAPLPLSSDELVGREEEVKQLRDILEHVQVGEPRVVLLGGEAGIGKSRLLSALVDGADRRGFVTLLGHCIDMGDTALPFAPVAQALRSFVRRVERQALDDVTGPGRAELARIVPELADGSGPGTQRHEGEARAHLFAAVLDMLGRIAEDQPTLLVFEDIHWADQSTLDLLDYVARNLLSEPLLVVGSFRTDELHRRHPLRGPLSELGRLRHVSRIDLAPFTEDDVAAQLDRILDHPAERELVEVITERSGGNPFYVEELLAAIRDADAAAGADVLPPALHDVVAGRVEQLPDDCRRVLSVAAVAGERVDHQLLELVDRLGDLDLVAALRQAVEHGVLLADAAGYRFRHALVREVIYDDLLPGERTSLHRAIAQTLDAHPGAAAGGAETVDAEVAHHWYVAHDSARALEASLRAAAKATDAAAYAEALRHYERALELWDEAGGTVGGQTRTDVMEAAADVAHLAGDARRAIALLREVIDGAPADVDPTVQALRYERLGRSQAWVEEDDTVLRSWERAMDLIPEEPPTAARAQVLSTYARGLQLFQPEEALALSREAVEIAREVGDPSVEASALLRLGSSLGPLDRLDESVARLREAIELAEEQSAASQVAEGYLNLAAMLIRGGRANEGADAALEGLERVRAYGVDRLYGPRQAGNATSGLFWAGRWDEADELVDELADRTVGLEWLMLLQGRLQAYRGEFEPARERLAEAVQHGADRDPRYPAIAITLEIHAKELDRAHELALEALDRDDPAHAGTVNQLRAVALQAEADRLHSADHETNENELRRLADRLLEGTTDRHSGGLGHAEPWRLTAVAEHSRITGDGSVSAWRDALEAWEAIEWPYQVAYASFRLAEAEFGDDGDGTESLRRAAGIAQRLGADPLLRDVTALADRIGELPEGFDRGS